MLQPELSASFYIYLISQDPVPLSWSDLPLKLLFAIKMPHCGSCLYVEHPRPCLLPCLHEPFYLCSHFVSQFLIIFLVNFNLNHIFYLISNFFPAPCCLLTCKSLSWLCLSRMRTRSCSSSTVPWSKSFSSIMALRRCSSSRFLSVSILICGGKRGGVGPHAFQRKNETAKSNIQHVNILYLYERTCISV